MCISPKEVKVTKATDS